MRKLSRSWILVGIIMLAAIASGAGVAVASIASHPAAGTGTGQASGYHAGTVSVPVPATASCCVNGYPLGVTATGQATVQGAGEPARTAAIARAAADARQQAAAAAHGAGITLGRIIDVQVSAPVFYPYPLEGAAGGAAVPGQSGSGTASGAVSRAPAVACPIRSQCGGYPFVGTTVTVTITWAIL